MNTCYCSCIINATLKLLSTKWKDLLPYKESDGSSPKVSLIKLGNWLCCQAWGPDKRVYLSVLFSGLTTLLVTVDLVMCGVESKKHFWNSNSSWWDGRHCQFFTGLVFRGRAKLQPLTRMECVLGQLPVIWEERRAKAKDVGRKQAVSGSPVIRQHVEMLF